MALTFNMAGGLPTNEQEIDQLLQKDNVYHDVYIFSSQEAERPIINSLFNYSKKELNNMLKKYLGINEDA